MHEEQSEFAGKTVRIKKEVKHPQVENFGGSEFRVEDWWDKLTGKYWGEYSGNVVCLIYALRIGTSLNTPPDDEVLYGKVGRFGHLVHISEIETKEG